MSRQHEHQQVSPEAPVALTGRKLVAGSAHHHDCCMLESRLSELCASCVL